MFCKIVAGRPSTLASGAGDPWVAQSTPNDLASVKLVPLDGSGEDTSAQGQNEECSLFYPCLSIFTNEVCGASTSFQ